MEKTFNKNDGKSDSVHSFNDALSATKEHVGSSLNSAYNSSVDGLGRFAEEAKKQAMSRGRDAGRMVNRQVYAQPWAYIAGASVFSWIVGYYMARRK